MVKDETKSFSIKPTVNFKVGLDVLRGHEFGMGIKVDLNGEESLILNHYDAQEYLVFADLFVWFLSERSYLLLETRMFDVDPSLCHVEATFSALHRSFMFKKTDGAPSMTRVVAIRSSPKALTDELGRDCIVYTLHTDRPLSDYVTVCTGQTCGGDKIEDLARSLVNIVFVVWSADLTTCRYVLPPSFFEDVTVFHVDSKGRLLMWRDENTQHYRSTWGASERLMAEQRSCTSIASSSGVGKSTTADDDEDMIFLGRHVQGRTKDSWSLQTLRDLANEHGIKLPSTLKRKMEMARFIRDRLDTAATNGTSTRSDPRECTSNA